MIQVLFKNMDKSELAKQITYDRLLPVFERFPDLEKSRIKVTLSVENSITQAGPDLFSVKIHCINGKYDSVILEKTAESLYAALADVTEHLLERLNRFGDRIRVKQRRKSRQINAKLSFAK